jgi:hypothetical protein
MVYRLLVNRRRFLLTSMASEPWSLERVLTAVGSGAVRSPR